MDKPDKTYYPTSAQAAAGQYQKALLLKNQKRYSEAIEFLQQAIRMNPNDITYTIEMANCYVHLNHPIRAVNILAPLYHKYPQNPSILKPYCAALLDSGQPEKAREVLIIAQEMVKSDMALKVIWDKVTAPRNPLK